MDEANQQQSPEELQNLFQASGPHWDVIVHCEDMKISCSSYILKSRSEYFQQVISMLSSLEEGIFLEEVSMNSE